MNTSTLDFNDVESIDLPDWTAQNRVVVQPSFSRVASESNSAQINEGALLSFEAALQEQNVEDVAYSILFSQLAADKQFDRKTAPRDWLTTFFNTLEVVGWIRQSFSDETKSASGTVDWRGLVIAKMPADVDSLVNASIDACDQLPQSSDAMKIWNAAISGSANGLFVIGAATDAAGTPTLSLGIASFQSTFQTSSFLSWDLQYAIGLTWSNMELNEDVYGKVRQTIIKKLGDRPKSLIASISIDQTGAKE